MDLSKLPKLSGDRPEVPPPPAAESPDAPYVVPYYAKREANPAEAWLSIAIGLIMLLLSPRIFQYLISPSTFAQKWTFNDGKGNPLAYTQTVYFWGDVCLTLFALSLIFEGLVLGFTRRQIWLIASILFTAMATLMNGGYVGYMMFAGYGLQMFSALAVAFGVYAVIVLWQRYQQLNALRA